MTLRNIVLGFVFLALAACATFEGGLTPKQRVHAIKLDFDAALDVALAYEIRPRCLPAQTLKDLCSDTEIVDAIRKASVTAWESVQGAQKTVNTAGNDAKTIDYALTGAMNAIEVFRNALTRYGVKK